MTSNSAFPTDIDAPVDPVSTNLMNQVPHAELHSLENDAIVAIETKLGVNGSGVTGSIDNLVKAAVDPGHTHTSASVPVIAGPTGATGRPGHGLS